MHFRLLKTIQENTTEKKRPPQTRVPPSLSPLSSSQTSDVTPSLRILNHPGLGTHPAQHSGRPQQGGVSYPSHQRPKPANCLVRGPLCSPNSRSGLDPEPPPGSFSGDADPTPPPACSIPHNSGGIPHVICSRDAVRANSPGIRAGTGGAGARREPGGTPWHRCERGGASVTHSIK